MEANELSSKAEVLGLVRSQLKSQFRRQGVDAGESGIEEVAKVGIEINGVGIAEVYSFRCVTAKATEFGLRPGFAVDLEEEKSRMGFETIC